MTDTKSTVRWGVLGPGRIARKFATGLQAAPGAELVAVGSRSQEHADAFGDEFGVPTRHASYEALASDPNVDVVYVATTHPQHMAATLLCLDHGKAVLCEKPFAMNLGQAEQMVASAREKKLFLMEAMWTRFRPAIRKAVELIDAGAIGTPELLQVGVGWGSPFDPTSRLFDKAAGGGILLDGGIYPLSLASHFLGEPAGIASLAHMAPTGVDDQAGVLLSYPSGAMASIVFSARVSPHAIATLTGTEGRIELHEDWHKPEGFTLRRADGSTEVYDFTLTEGNGYQYEAMHVMACLREGKTESDVMPLDETLALMKTLDTIRAQWGLVYDDDAAAASQAHAGPKDSLSFRPEPTTWAEWRNLWRSMLAPSGGRDFSTAHPAGASLEMTRLIAGNVVPYHSLKDSLPWNTPPSTVSRRSSPGSCRAP